MASDIFLSALSDWETSSGAYAPATATHTIAVTAVDAAAGAILGGLFGLIIEEPAKAALVGGVIGAVAGFCVSRTGGAGSSQAQAQPAVPIPGATTA